MPTNAVIVAEAPALPNAPGSSPAPEARAIRFTPHRITIDRYNRMMEARVYHEKDRVSLRRGGFVETMTKGSSHMIAQIELHALLVRLVPEDWHVRQGQPMRFGDDGMPDLDLAIARGDSRMYRAHHPSARGLEMIVEVSDTSLAADTGEGLAVYAKEAVPVYWIVNFRDRRDEVDTMPTGLAASPSSLECRHHGPDDEVPVRLESREVGRVAVRNVLP